MDQVAETESAPAEGDGWVDWSGLATLLAAAAELFSSPANRRPYSFRLMQELIEKVR
jgi:hypothetical protein